MLSWNFSDISMVVLSKDFVYLTPHCWHSQQKVNENLPDIYLSTLFESRSPLHYLPQQLLKFHLYQQLLHFHRIQYLKQFLHLQVLIGPEPNPEESINNSACLNKLTTRVKLGLSSRCLWSVIITENTTKISRW